MSTYTLYFHSNPNTTTSETLTLSLHDALPIFARAEAAAGSSASTVIGAAVRPWRVISSQTRCQRRPVSNGVSATGRWNRATAALDRKSTRLNSSHVKISYAVFCLKKKTTTEID